MKIKRIRMKLLLAMLLTTIIPLSITAGIILYQVSQNMDENNRLAKDRTEQDMKGRIEEYGKDLFDSAYSVYYNMSLLESLANDKDYVPSDTNTYDTAHDMRELLYGIYLKSRLKDITGVYLVNSQDEMVGSFFLNSLLNYSVLNKTNLESLRKDLDHAKDPMNPLTVFHYKSIYGEPSLQYLFPLQFKEKRIGILVIDVKETYFRNMVEKYNQFYKGQIRITDRSKQIVYHTDPTLINTPLTTNSSRHTITIEVPIELSDWTLSYVYQVNPQLILFQRVAVGMICLAFLLALLISLYLSYGITKPIVSLHHNMRLIQKGDYTARAKVQTLDEIGFLGNQFNSMAETIQQLIEHDLKLQLVNKETHIRALQAQISPHFLHNTLQAMSNIATIRGVPEVKLICECLSNMYRYNMNITDEWVSLKEEVMHVRNYLVIINKRYPEILRIRVRMDSSLTNLIVPKLIIQPIVENAVEHGLISSRLNKKLLKLYFQKDEANQLFIIHILDNGTGITDEDQFEINHKLQMDANLARQGKQSDDSIGMYNVQTRIHLLCGLDYGLSVQSKRNKGTHIQIKLPLKEVI
ncbi:HAMP domain-containing protein [Paenibacillus psychroresistens]|uniref:HAMP domain-containing protein n=1 Tax=Paenibacillus psychroresistens TaxID=1778678 RepID=A0A6B8RDD9_9BACL|nr:sensor histidine kinase [Paenibacillus psychroresistens]QGQ94451.1 HAMP domain-containing protein [Paenibacillus psychroresistens]